MYAGLTASGYELASLREEDPMAAVAARAANLSWSKDLIAYFRLRVPSPRGWASMSGGCPR
ncbi:MAG: hypothetical protein PHP20_06230 [Firmicutes bacterium]|nr:hypothetical protein [Bacillota bacterium]